MSECNTITLLKQNNTNTKAEGRKMLNDKSLYIGDDGRCTCGAHAGATARASGRDIDGTVMMDITEIAPELGLACETCKS